MIFLTLYTIKGVHVAINTHPSILARFVILMKKKTEDAEGNDDIEEAFRIFDSKNDGLGSHDLIMSMTFKCVFCGQ